MGHKSRIAQKLCWKLFHFLSLLCMCFFFAFLDEIKIKILINNSGNKVGNRKKNIWFGQHGTQWEQTMVKCVSNKYNYQIPCAFVAISRNIWTREILKQGKTDSKWTDFEINLIETTTCCNIHPTSASTSFWVFGRCCCVCVFFSSFCSKCAPQPKIKQY